MMAVLLLWLSLALLGGNTNAAPSCSSLECRGTDKCKIVNGDSVCSPDSEAYCHIDVDKSQSRTFDGHSYDFQGSCTYTVAKTLKDKSLPYFNIELKNEIRDNSLGSSIISVIAQLYEYNISLAGNENGFVRVNNQQQQLPVSLNDGQVRVLQSGKSVAIKTDFAMEVVYELFSLIVNIPSSFSEKVGGLCGNYNGNSSDDLMTPTGVQAPDLVEFRKSWKVEDRDRFCWHSCGECKTCPLNTQRLYSNQKSCGMLSLPDGPFYQCHNIINPKPYVDNCVYDLCMNVGSKQILCQSLQTYADACQRSTVEIGEWRSLSGCDSCKSIKCNNNENCIVQEGNPVCISDITGTCLLWNDSLFRDFNGNTFVFQGNCSYILSKYDGADKRLVPFTIEVNKVTSSSQAESGVRTFNIHVHGYKITMKEDEFGKARVNDVSSSLPPPLDGKILAKIIGHHVIIEIDFGLMVTYDPN